MLQSLDGEFLRVLLTCKAFKLLTSTLFFKIAHVIAAFDLQRLLKA